MMRHILDTNALISYVTDRDPDQQRQVAPLFEASARLESALLCPQHVLSEFVYVLQNIYNVDSDRIAAILRDFISMPGVEIVHEVHFETLLSLWPDPVRDFGDAIVASVAKRGKGAEIVTFDRKFGAVLRKIGLKHHVNIIRREDS